MGWGRAGRGAFISASRSPTFSHLYPGLPLCPSVLPSSSSGCQSHPPPSRPPVCPFWAGLQAPLLWGPGSPSLCVEARVLGELGQDFQGPEGAGRRWRGASLWAVSQSWAQLLSPSCRGLLCLVPAPLRPSEALTSELSPLQPRRRRGSGPGPPAPSGPLGSLSGPHSATPLFCCN